MDRGYHAQMQSYPTTEYVTLGEMMFCHLLIARLHVIPIPVHVPVPMRVTLALMFL